MSAGSKINAVRSLLAGDPVFLAGSLVAEHEHGLRNAHSDIDIFCPTQQVLIATGQKLLCQGYTLDDKFKRVWARWLKYGMKGWHTNSLRIISPGGDETNLVYKLSDGHPTTSLSQVLESFDFGLLGVGWDLERDVFADLRPFLFPEWTGNDPMQPLPLMPKKRSDWRNGFISQYNGIREIGRYAKYHGYGYDMSLIKDDLTTGYWAAATYFSNSFEEDKRKLGQMYELIAKHIEFDNYTELEEAAKKIDYSDELDVIMAALE